MLDGFTVISSYSREEAIADGILIDLSARFPDLCRQVFKFPVACTDTVWALVERAVASKADCNDPAGVVWDILHMAVNGIIEELNESTRLFRVIITGTGAKRYHDLKVIVGPGDDAEPVITIMFPQED